MPAQTRAFVLRLSVVDDGGARAFAQLGQQGAQALRQLNTQQAGYRQNTLQASAATQGWVEQLRANASAIAVLQGPLGGVASRVNAFATLITRVHLTTALWTVGIGAAVAAIGGLILGFTRAVGAGFQFERVMNRIQAQIELTQGTFDGTAQSVNRLAQQLAFDTLAGTTQAREAASRALAIPGIDEAQLRRVLRLGQDMVEVFGSDLVTNVELLGKSFVSPSSSLDELRRRFIQFTPEQREAIQNFSDMGEVAKAAEIILKALEDRIGGVGEAAAQDLPGIFDTILERSQSILEKLGQWAIEWHPTLVAAQGLAGILTFVDDEILVARDRLGELEEELAGVVEKIGELEGDARVRGRGFAEARLDALRQQRGELEEQIRLLRESAALADDMAHATVMQARAQAEANRLANLGLDIQRLVREQVGEIEFETKLLGLPEAEQEVERFKRTLSEDFPSELVSEADLTKLRQAARDREAAEERIAAARRASLEAERAEAERIRNIERRAPVPALRPDALSLAQTGPLLGVPDRAVDFRARLSELSAELDPITARLERIRATTEFLQRSESIELLGPEQAERLRLAAEEQARFLEQIDRAVETARRFREAFGEAALVVQEGAEAVGSRLADSFTTFFTGQQSLAESFRSLWTGVFEDISRLAAQFAIRQAFLGLANTSGPGLLATVFSGIAGARASGGPVEEGKTYLVGEKGPELFRAPSRGWIDPSRGRYLGRAQFGGEWVVGGSGGPDSQLVSLRASPGERISASPPGGRTDRLEVTLAGAPQGTAEDAQLAERLKDRLTSHIRRIARESSLDLVVRNSGYRQKLRGV